MKIRIKLLSINETKLILENIFSKLEKQDLIEMVNKIKI